MGLEPELVLNEDELEENKLTIKKVMDINKCVAAFLAEQEPNEKQVRNNLFIRQRSITDIKIFTENYR